MKTRIKAIFSAIVIAVCLAGCGGGGANPVAGASGTGALKGFGWFFENLAPDYFNSGETCAMQVFLYYDSALSQSDIAGFTVTAPNGGTWGVNAPNLHFVTSSSGKPYISARLYSSNDPRTMPLAGTWTAAIRLANGQTASLQRELHEPGSSAAATHPYLYTKEDLFVSANASDYIAALGRFPAQGYTAQYSAANGGAIRTVGFAAVRAGYLAAEPTAYNFVCWLYDASNAYLGYTTTAYSTLDHSPTTLVGADGELSIVPALIIPSVSSFNLSNVRYMRVMYTDGAQFAPASYSGYDYRSISSLISVN